MSAREKGVSPKAKPQSSMVEVDGEMSEVSCRVCGRTARPWGEAKVLDRYWAEYHRCSACGFVQVESPSWLDDAYATKDLYDVGAVSRSLRMADITASLVSGFLEGKGPFLDFGAGAGLFVRLMRDRGFPFYATDKYAGNVHALGFERRLVPPDRYEAITAFEVIEHLPDPGEVLLSLAEHTDHIFLSTELLPPHEPRPGCWWYYDPKNGKHIGIFTERSLKVLGDRAGMRLHTDGVRLHLLTRRRFRVNPVRFALSRSVRIFQSFFRKRSSLTEADFKFLSGGQRD